MNPDAELIVDHHFPKLVRVVLIFFTRIKVVEECWSRNLGILRGQLPTKS